MNLFTVGSLIICVDLELFIPVKEAYLYLMSLESRPLITPQILVGLKLNSEITKFFRMYLENFR